MLFVALVLLAPPLDHGLSAEYVSLVLKEPFVSRQHLPPWNYVEGRRLHDRFLRRREGVLDGHRGMHNLSVFSK